MCDSFFDERDSEGEGGTPARRRIHAQLSTVKFGNGAADIESHAHAFGFCGIEGVKEFGTRFFRNARSVINDLELKTLGFLFPMICMEFDGSLLHVDVARGARFHSVLQEI